MNALINHTEKFVNVINDVKAVQQNNEWTPIWISFGVFVGGYLLLRFIEKFVLHVVPDWIFSEVSALYRWGPVLLPIAFGLTYMNLPKKQSTIDPLWKNLFGKKKERRKISSDEKRMVGATQQWKCAICQQNLPSAYEVDHIKPLWKGGEDIMSNLQALCPNCHGEKTLRERMSVWSAR